MLELIGMIGAGVAKSIINSCPIDVDADISSQEISLDIECKDFKRRKLDYQIKKHVSNAKTIDEWRKLYKESKYE